MIFINMISLKKLIVEGRYDSLVTALSRKLLQVIKDSYACTKDPEGFFGGEKIYYKKGEEVPHIEDSSQIDHIYFEEVENPDIPLDFYLTLKVQWIEGFNDVHVGGDAYNETKRGVADAAPLIEIRFKLDPADYPKVLSEIAFDLRDTLRHEIEHITQSGWNTIDSKYIPSDQAMRNKIESGKLPPARYFTLPKEIDAMIQGLYLRAKKTRTPFKQVVDNYLNIWVSNQSITETDKQNILKVWRERLPKLGIRQEI
jgi:hypothetical protein